MLLQVLLFNPTPLAVSPLSQAFYAGTPLDLVRTKRIRKHDLLFLISASLLVPPRVRLPLDGVVEAVKAADLEAPRPTPLRGHVALEVSPPPGLSLGEHRRAPLEDLLRATL